MNRHLSSPHVLLTGATLGDQAVVSLGNFLTQIILARGLAPHDYGVFALLFGTLYLANVCHWAVVAYPLCVHGAGCSPRQLRKMAAGAMVLTISLAAPLGLLPLTASLILHRADLALWAFLAMLLWQLQETLRRGLMAHLNHHRAVWGDGLSYLGQGAVVWCLSATGNLSVRNAFAAVIVTSTAATGIQGFQLGWARTSIENVRELARRFWQVGSRAVLAHFADTGAVLALPWALALSRGPQAAASFQAALNILGISHPLMYGIGNVVVPASARAAQEDGPGSGWSAAKRYGRLGLWVLLPYALILFFFPQKILHLFYGSRGSYVSEYNVLRILLLAGVCTYLFGVITAFLNGMKRPGLVLLAEVWGLAAAVFISVPMAIAFGLWGATVGLLVLLLARLGTGYLLLGRYLGSLKRKTMDCAHERSISGATASSVSSD